jgi:hypothetical protein
VQTQRDGRAATELRWSAWLGHALRGNRTPRRVARSPSNLWLRASEWLGESGDRLCRLKTAPDGTFSAGGAGPSGHRTLRVENPRSSRAAVQLLCQADAGPFAAPGAEAPRTSQDARRHAACNRVKRQSAAGSVPLCPQARGAAATAYTKHVSRTNQHLRGGALSMKLRVPSRSARASGQRPMSGSGAEAADVSRMYHVRRILRVL